MSIFLSLNQLYLELKALQNAMKSEQKVLDSFPRFSVGFISPPLLPIGFFPKSFPAFFPFITAL